jgi:hypothetical protein
MSDHQAPAAKQSCLIVGSVGIGTTLLYLWLAVLGSGGFAAYFSHPTRIVIAVVSIAMASTALFSDANLSSGEREDRSNRWIFIPLLVIGLLSAFLPAYTERKEWGVLDGDAGGLASSSMWQVVRCGSGPPSSWVADSAGWWPSSPGMSW